jgi:hemerythrin
MEHQRTETEWHQAFPKFNLLFIFFIIEILIYLCHYHIFEICNILCSLQTEKQQKLNEVECLVVLKLSQMQHFKMGTNTMENLSNSLLFSQKTLQQLYSRAGELKKETQIQMDKHM